MNSLQSHSEHVSGGCFKAQYSQHTLSCRKAWLGSTELTWRIGGPTQNRWPLICLQSWPGDTFHVLLCGRSPFIYFPAVQWQMKTIKRAESFFWRGDFIFYFLSFFKAKLFFNRSCQKCSKRWWRAEAHPLHFHFHWSTFTRSSVCFQ